MENMVRLRKISVVLAVTLVLNTLASVIKIVLGAVTGVSAITADGLHSFGDYLSNVVGLFGMRLARRKPDGNHGYGYERYEAIVTLLVVSLISITCYKVFETGIHRLMKPSVISIRPLELAVMLASMLVNVITVLYEGRAGKRLKSSFR